MARLSLFHKQSWFYAWQEIAKYTLPAEGERAASTGVLPDISSGFLFAYFSYMINATWFYVISFKWTKNWVYTFWRWWDAGYTTNLKFAWKYSKEQIESNYDYYNNDDNLAIPCSYINTHFKIVSHVEVDREKIKSLLCE